MGSIRKFRGTIHDFDNLPIHEDMKNLRLDNKRNSC